MKHELITIDRILSSMTVSGENVMLLAAARSALKKLYDELKEESDVSSESSE